MPTQRIILDQMRMRATPDISRFILYQAGGDENMRTRLRAAFRGKMRGKCFQVQDETGAIPWRTQRSFLEHLSRHTIQTMIGTDPETTVRDLSYFYRCYFGSNIDDMLKGRKAVVLGFGPKWPELFLPHLNREGTAVFPLASIMRSIIGIDYLVSSIAAAGEAMRRYYDDASARHCFPAVEHERDNRVQNPYQQEKERIVEGAYSVDAERMVQALKRIVLFQSAIEATPESVLSRGSVSLVSAVGVFDADPLGLDGYNAENENPSAVENVRDIFRRIHRMLSYNGFLMIGRGAFDPGAYYALSRAFETIASETKMSMIFMVPNGKKWKEDPENLFGFIKDGAGEMIFIDYPFPLPKTISYGCLGGETKYPKWKSEHDFVSAGQDHTIERKPNRY